MGDMTFDEMDEKLCNLKELGHKKAKQKICLCWLNECECKFQRHKGLFTLCESEEIFKKCINHEDINYE